MEAPTSRYGCGSDTCVPCYGDEEYQATLTREDAVVEEFRVVIETENDAFMDWDGHENPQEVVRILRKIADRLDDGDFSLDTSHMVSDVNGNAVGYFIWR
jgi:hypothetical protein